MRVISGAYRSRHLSSLRGVEIRPTSDRLRETLFNVLTGGAPDALRGSIWLDLFAGTGAVGIEALSRGAERVVFVEAARAASRLIGKNLAALGIASGHRLLTMNVATALGQLEGSGFDYVFLDPPYRMEREYAMTMSGLARPGVLSPGAIVIAEHSDKFDPGSEVANLTRYRTLTQGDAALSFYRVRL